MPKIRFGVDLEHTKYEHLFDMSEKDIIATLKKNHRTTLGQSSDEVLEKQIKKFLLYDKKKNKIAYEEKGAIVSKEEEKAYKELEETKIPSLIATGLDKIIRDNNAEKVKRDVEKTNQQVNQQIDKLGKTLKDFGAKNNKAVDQDTEAELKRLVEENKEDDKKAEAFDKKKEDIRKKAQSIYGSLNVIADMNLLDQVLYTVENADKDDKGVAEYLDAIAKGLTEVDKNLKNEAALHKNMISLSTTTKEYNKAQIPSEWEFYEAPQNKKEEAKEKKKKHQIKTKDTGNILENLSANELDANEVGRNAIYEAPKTEIKDKHKLKVETSKQENEKDDRTIWQRLFGKKKKPTAKDLMTEVNNIEQTDVLDRKPRQPGTMDQLLTQLKNNKRKSQEKKKEEVKTDPVEKVEKKEEKKNMGENADNNQNNNNKPKEEEQEQINVPVGNNENNTENKPAVEKTVENVGQDPAKKEIGSQLNNENVQNNNDLNKEGENKDENEPANPNNNDNEKEEDQKKDPVENNNMSDNKDKEEENKEVEKGKDDASQSKNGNIQDNKDNKEVEKFNPVEINKKVESQANDNESDINNTEKNVDQKDKSKDLNEKKVSDLEKNENNSKVENENGADKKTEEIKEQKNGVTESKLDNKEVEKPQSEKTEKNVDGNNNQDSLNKDEQRIVLVNPNVSNLKPKNVNNSQVVDPMLAEAEAKATNINHLTENIVNDEKKILVDAKNTNLKIANEAKIKIDPVDDSAEYKKLSQYEKSLNEHVANSQVVKDSNLLRKSSKCNEADEAMLNRSFNTLQEDEAEVRKYIPAKTDNINISVPDLIKNQMRLEAGQMRPDEKKDHFQNIINMKGEDGDKYAKELVDYRLKVAEEAGREFEKKHQDPTRLSFLNKSANAIETIMCAMTRNPLGIMMMLAAAVYAPLLMVGLLAFTAWKRKRPNPAYQNAWQEQNRREMEAKRQQLATSYGCEANQISDREVKDALKQDYVQEKIIESMQAKLERDARKVVDSAAKDYAKAISKESGTKYSAKDLKDIAQKDLMRKDPRYGSNAATLSTQREDNLRQHIKNHEKKRKESGMGGRSM